MLEIDSMSPVAMFQVSSVEDISFGGQSLRESQLWDLGSNRRSALCSFSFSFTVKRGPASFFFFSSIVQVTGYRAGNVDVCFRVPLERRPQEGVRDVLHASILTAWHQDKGSEHLLLPKPLCPEDPEVVVFSKYWRSPIFFLPLQFVAQGLVRQRSHFVAFSNENCFKDIHSRLPWALWRLLVS